MPSLTLMSTIAEEVPCHRTNSLRFVPTSSFWGSDKESKVCSRTLAFKNLHRFEHTTSLLSALLLYSGSENIARLLLSGLRSKCQKLTKKLSEEGRNGQTPAGQKRSEALVF